MAFVKNLDKISNTELQDVISRGFSQFLPVRVVSIDQSESLSNGNIIGEILTPLATLPNQSQITALPAFPNVKNFPLINEVVFCITAPSGDYSSNTGNISYYYLTPLNIWKNINTNPTPNPFTNLKPDSQNKTIQEVEAGSTNKSSEENTNEFKPGTYFEEKSDVFPLYPFEGDYIIEGRWGNSIRFGSTAENLTPWSVTGSAGDPITIIRNGQNPELVGPAQSTTIEDINKDQSSIYVTSTQQIPIEVASTNDYLSYSENAPIEPKAYSKSQVILNSGRLVLNAKEDHILLSSNKTINLNSVEGVNIDTTGTMVFQGPKIQLGSSEADESVLLGDSTIDLLQNLLADLRTLFNIVGNQLGNSGILLEPAGSTYRTLANNIEIYSAQLNNVKSNITKVE